MCKLLIALFALVATALATPVPEPGPGLLYSAPALPYAAPALRYPAVAAAPIALNPYAAYPAYAPAALYNKLY